MKHTSNAKNRQIVSHRLLKLSNQLANDLQDVFNHWSKVMITNSEVKQLIQIAMAPNQETTEDLRNGKLNDISRCFKIQLSMFLSKT